MSYGSFRKWASLRASVLRCGKTERRSADALRDDTISWCGGCHSFHCLASGVCSQHSHASKDSEAQNASECIYAPVPATTRASAASQVRISTVYCTKDGRYMIPYVTVSLYKLSGSTGVSAPPQNRKRKESVSVLSGSPVRSGNGTEKRGATGTPWVDCALIIRTVAGRPF